MDDDDRGGFRKGNIPFKKALRIAEEASKRLWACSEAVLIVGSIRRQQQIVGDVDLLVLPKDLDRTLAKLEDHGFVGGDRIRRKMVNGALLEIYLAHDDREMGSMLIHTIGSKEFNQELRRIAKRSGWLLNQYGLFDGKGKLVLQSPDERDFFDALGVPWRPPEERNSGSSPSMGAVLHPENRPDAFTEALFPGIEWELKPDLQKPDKSDEGKQVWYYYHDIGKRSAEVLRYRDGGWEYGEYHEMEASKVMGYTVFLSYLELIRAIYEKLRVEVPLEAIEAVPDLWSVYAKTVGSVKLNYDETGGTERRVDHLP